MATVEEIFKKYEICYIYNETFRYYREGEFTREEAEKYCEDRNQCKDGRYSVRPKGEYQEDYELKIWLGNPVSGGKPKTFVERPIMGDFI